MTSSANYAKRAAECIELAETMSGDNRLKLLEISQAWLSLADEAVAKERQTPLIAGQTAVLRLQ